MDGALDTRFAKVLLPNALNRPLDYRLEGADDSLIQAGSVVEVPFRQKNEYGIVLNISETSSVDPKKLKSIHRVVEGIFLSEQDLKFIKWMANYTLNPMGMIARLFLSNRSALEPLIPKFGWQSVTGFSGALTSRQQQVLRDLDSLKIYPTAIELQRQHGCSKAVVDALLEKGALKRVPMKQDQKALIRTPDPNFTKMRFTALQSRSIEALIRQVSQKSFSCTLLDGVTGSGKTEVYFEAIACLIDPVSVTQEGGQVVVLVPEISLTPQLLERFEARFGVRPAQWHSKLSVTKRREIYRQVANGTIKVLVGARSALFLPYKKLVGIIVDEEHETSYKQEEQVIYHARDMAVARASFLNIPVVLVSATPSLESLYNAKIGKYQQIKLYERHGAAGFPDVSLINMRDQAMLKSSGGIPQWLSESMLADLKTNLEAGDQSLLFLNRRGYAPLTLCQACGEKLSCPNCSSWLVEHRDRGCLSCHHCGYYQQIPKHCPSCDAQESLTACGPGVERIQEEVLRRLPGARPFLMASDAFEDTSSLLEAITAIQSGAYDVIIGTQIMAKGHNFPHLTYVGVVDADLGLSGGDLRASERTYQLLQQVSGRCGRHDKPGRVALQTYYPDHPVLQALKEGNRDAFIENELLIREQGHLPPYSRLAALVISSKDDRAVKALVQTMRRHAPESNQIRILGPVTAPMSMLRGFHRWRFLLQADKKVNIQGFIRAWLEKVEIPSSFKVQVDIDPVSFT